MLKVERLVHFERLNMAKTAWMIVITSSIFLLATTVLADTYRWVDDNGVVNYAERVPRDVPAERVSKISGTESKRSGSRTRSNNASTASNPAMSGTSSSTQAAPLNPNQKEIMRDLAQVEAQRAEQIARIRADNCIRAQRVLTNLTASSRIRARAEDGTERVIGEDERQQKIAEARQGIAENCDA